MLRVLRTISSLADKRREDAPCRWPAFVPALPPKLEWTLGAGLVTMRLMTDLKLIKVDAIRCPSCRTAGQLRPVYQCVSRPPRSDALIGLACASCWPADIAFPAKFDDPRWAQKRK